VYTVEKKIVFSWDFLTQKNILKIFRHRFTDLKWIIHDKIGESVANFTHIYYKSDLENIKTSK